MALYVKDYCIILSLSLSLSLSLCLSLSHSLSISLSLFQEEIMVKVDPLKEKLKAFEKVKLTYDETAKHIKVRVRTQA